MNRAQLAKLAADAYRPTINWKERLKRMEERRQEPGEIVDDAAEEVNRAMANLSTRTESLAS